MLWSLTDRLQISLLILSEFKRICYLPFPLKSSEKLWFKDEWNFVIRLNSLNIRGEIWRSALRCCKETQEDVYMLSVFDDSHFEKKDAEAFASFFLKSVLWYMNLLNINMSE